MQAEMKCYALSLAGGLSIVPLLRSNDVFMQVCNGDSAMYQYKEVAPCERRDKTLAILLDSESVAKARMFCPSKITLTLAMGPAAKSDVYGDMYKREEQTCASLCAALSPRIRKE
jgi:hypothetical protein